MKQYIQTFRRFVSTLLLYLFRVFPINNKKIVFSSYFSTKVSDNPKAIFEAMLKIHPDYEYIWLLKSDTQVAGAEVVNAGSIKGLFHLATAKCWVDNSRKRSWVRKRKKQFYVQTWHGNIAFKKVEADVADKLPELYIKAAKNDSKMTDVFISGSKWLTNSYRKSFWYDGYILESGLPRSDIFYQDSKNVCNLVKKLFNDKYDVHYILYAPTFRVNDTVDYYMNDFDDLITMCHKTFGGDWKVLVRLHPRIVQKQNFIEYSDSIINASNYPDINELIVTSDILISDYSSCMFDAMEAGKKVFLYALDIDDYMSDRGCEFDLEELPFSISTSKEQLLENIQNFNSDVYTKDVNSFVEKCGIFNNADSSSIVADYIFDHIQS